jgi:ligand-binding sensor domain-containing protein
MPWSLPRRRALFLALGLLAVGGALGAYLKLRRDVGKALEGPLRSSAPLQFVTLARIEHPLDRWGGGEVEGVALVSGSLITAGGFGVADEKGDLGPSLPTLRATALTSWREHTVVGLASGGVFLFREGQWEELRSGFGQLHVRALQEGAGGELWIGAREGLYRLAWGASTVDRVDAVAVKSIALGKGGMVFAGGEEGLRRIEGLRASAVATPDPWVEWVGVVGRELRVITPLGLAKGFQDGPLAAVSGGEEASAAALLGPQCFAVVKGRLLRFESDGHATEELLPAPARRVFTAQGHVFVDTTLGLLRRAASGWVLARPRPSAFPPGSSHVNALAQLDSRIVVGLFNGGLVQGEEAVQGKASGARWTTVPGSSAWGVNALLNGGGSLYVASLRGASRFDGQRLHQVEGGDAGAAFSLAATPGGLAVGFGQGVSLPGGRFLSAFHGLPGNQALALAAGAQLFVGTPSGLGAIAGNRVAWRVTAGEGKLPHPWITALLLQGEALFIGTYGGGVVRRTASQANPNGPGQFDAFPETEGLKVNPGCLVEAGGRLYLGTDGKGLYRLSQDGRRFLPVRVPLPSQHVTAILPAKDVLFVGTDEGLARLNLPLPDEGV